MKKFFLFLFVPFCSFANLELNLKNDIYLNYTIAKNTKLLYSNSLGLKYMNFFSKIRFDKIEIKNSKNLKKKHITNIDAFAGVNFNIDDLEIKPIIGYNNIGYLSITAKYGKQLKGYISSTIYFDNSSLNELGLEYVKNIKNSKIKIKVGTNLSSANNFKPIYLSSIEINQKNIVNSHVHFVIGLKLFNYGNSHGIGLTSDINIH